VLWHNKMTSFQRLLSQARFRPDLSFWTRDAIWIPNQKYGPLECLIQTRAFDKDIQLYSSAAPSIPEYIITFLHYGSFHILIYTSPSNILLASRHNNIRLRANRILRLPETSHSLLLSVELHTRLAIESVRSTTRDGLLVSGEREHGEGHRDGDVDSNLAGLDLFLEARGGCAGAGEDRGAVAVFVCVDEGGDGEADEDGAEDFFFVAGHFGGYVCDDCGADLGGKC
jgi:hypothetical protein